MRIAVLCSDLGVRVPGTKGASLHLQAVATGFAALGHDVLLVGVAGHGEPPVGVRTYLFPHPGRTTGLRRELRKLRFTRRFRRESVAVLRDFAPDFVYERLALFGTAGSGLARDLEVPHVVEVNALLAQEEAQWRGLRLGALARRRERDVLAASSLRVAVSNEWAQRIDALAPGRPTVVVQNGVDTALFGELPSRAESRRALGLDDDQFVMAFTGALRPWHGIEVALDAMRHRGDDEVLVVAGDGDIRTELERRAERSGLGGRVRWLGQVPHEQIVATLAAADVAVGAVPGTRWVRLLAAQVVRVPRGRSSRGGERPRTSTRRPRGRSAGGACPPR